MDCAHYGGHLQTRTAAGGTVRLIVNHDESSYRIEKDDASTLADEWEILAYLHHHNFEIMPEDECPSEHHEDCTVLWACHHTGNIFHSRPRHPFGDPRNALRGRRHLGGAKGFTLAALMSTMSLTLILLWVSKFALLAAGE